MSVADESPMWADQEMKMMNVVDVFIQKPIIMKKAEGYLEVLKHGLIREIAESQIKLPKGTDVSKGQIARGENHNGFPYISLDMPQKFSKTDMFTYRTLFWWGHYLGFSLILKGNGLPQYMENISQSKLDKRFNQVFLSLASNPWEWTINEYNFKLISETSKIELEQTIRSLEYIKLIRIHPVSEDEFSKLDWILTGVETFKHWMEILLE